MMTASGAATPGHTTTGAPFAKTRNPAPGDFAGSNAIVREWGDGLYAVAWGVYHALPQDKNLPLFGTAPPNVSVTFTVTGTLDAGSGVSIPAGTITVPAFLVRPDGTNWPADLGLSLAEMNTLKITGLALPTDMTTTQFQGTTDNVYPWVAKVPITNNGTLIDMRYNPGATYRIRAVATIRQESDTDGGIRSPKSDTSIPLFLGQHDYLGKTDSQTQANINDKAKLGEERSLFVAHPFAVSVRGGANFGTNGPNLIGWFGDISTAFTDSQKAEILANGNDLGFPVNGGGVKNLGTKTLFAPLGMVQDNQSKGYTVLGGINDAEIKPGLYVVDRSNLSRTFGPSVSVKVKATVVSAHWMGRTTSVMNPLPWEQFPTETESTPDYPALSSEAFTLTSGGKSVTETGINLNQPGGLSAINRILNPTQIDLSVKIPKFQPANVNFGRWTDGKRGTYGAGFEGQDGVVRGNGAKAGAMFGPLVIGTGDVTNNRDYLYPSGGYISNIRLDSTTAPVNGNANVNYAGVYGQKGAPYRFMDMGVSVPPTVRMKMGVDTIDLGKLSHSAGYSDLVEKSNDFRSPFAPFNLGAGFDPTLPVPTKEDYWSSYFRPFTLISESNVNLVRVRIAKLFGPNNSTIGVGSLTNFPGANVATALQVKATSNDDTTLLPIFGIGIAQPGLRNIGIVSSFDHPSLNSNNYSETNLWEKVLNPFVTNAGITNAGLPLVDRPATGELGWGNQIQRQPTVHKPRIGDNAGTVASIPDIPYNSSLALQFPGGFKTELPKISVAIPLGTPSGEYKSKIIAYEDNTPFQWRNWLLISKNLNTDPTNPGADADGILNSYSNDPAKFSDFALEAFTDPGMTLKVQVVETRLTNNAGKGSLAQMDPLLDPNLTQFPSANLMPTVVTSLGVPEKGVSYNGVSMFWPTNRGTKNGQGVNALTPWSLAFSWLSTSATELRANGNSPVQIGEARFVVPGSDAQPQGAHWWAIPTPYVDLTNTTLLQTLFPSNVVEATATGSLYLQGNRNPATARAISPAATRLEEIGNLYSTEGVLFWQGQIVKTDGIRQVTDSRTFYTKLGLTKLGAAGGSLAPVGVTQSFLNDPALTKQNPKPLYVMLPATRDSPKQVVTFLFWQAGNRSKSQLYYNANATADLEPGAWSKDTILPTPAALSSLSEPTAVLRRAFNANGNLVDAIEVAYSGKIKNRNNIEILLSRFEIGREIINEKTVITLKPMLLPNSFREPTVTKPGVVGTYIARDAAWILDNKPENKILVQAPDGKGGFNLLNPGNGKFEEGTGLVYFDSTVGGQIVVDTRAGSVSFPNIAPPRGTTIYVTYTPQVARLNVSRNESNFDVFTNNNGGFSLLEPSLNRQPAGNIIGDNTNPTMIIDRTPNRRNRLSAPSVVFAPNGTAVSPLAGDAFIPSLARRWLLYRKAAPTGTLSGIYYKTQRVVIQLPRSVRVNYNANGSSFVALSILNGVQGSGYEVDWARGRVYFDEQMDGQKVTIIFTDSTGTTHQGMTYIAKWGDETNSSSGGTTEALMPIDTSVSEGQVTAYKDPFVDKLWVYWTSTRNGVSDLYYQTIAPQFYPNQP